MKIIGVIFLILTFICWRLSKFCEAKIDEIDHQTKKGGAKMDGKDDKHPCVPDDYSFEVGV